MDSQLDDVGRLFELVGRYRDFTGPFQFSDVIEAISGYDVIRVQRGDVHVTDLLERLDLAGNTVLREAQSRGIRRGRANEAGNEMKEHAELGLEEARLSPIAAIADSGASRMGYPDFRIESPAGLVGYVTVKTFASGQQADPRRRLYISPPRHVIDCKVAEEAYHFILAFEMASIREANQTVFRPIAFSVVDAASISVRLKYEFYASNQDMYGGGSLVRGALHGD